MITGALARSKELRQAARKAALKDAVVTIKSKSGNSHIHSHIRIRIRSHIRVNILVGVTGKG